MQQAKKDGGDEGEGVGVKLITENGEKDGDVGGEKKDETNQQNNQPPKQQQRRWDNFFVDDLVFGIAALFLA